MPTKPKLDQRTQTVERIRNDPVWFTEHVLGWGPWSKQREVLCSVRDNPRTAVRSGHGVGKTRVAAGALLWFLSAFPDCRVISTAPTFKPGVRDLLWREVRAQHRMARVPIGGRCMTTDLEIADNWFAAGYSTDEPERFSGHHAPHLLLIVDEASGVAEEIYEAAEGFMTGEHARVLLIGNPTRTSGQFHSAFTTERALWHGIHIDVLDSPNLSGEKVPDHVARALPTRAWVEDKVAKWGTGSALYEVRVRGNFPAHADDTVVDLASVEAAQARELAASARKDSITVACDVARFGSDETVIAVKVGNRVRIEQSYVGRPTTETAGRVASIARRYPDAATHIVIDDDGVGGGVTDILREQGFEVVPFNGAGTPFRPDDYPNRRSELWFTAAERMGELDLDEDDQLAADLTAPRYGFDSRGRRVVEPKQETKKRLGRSPDRGDAVLLTLVGEPRWVSAPAHPPPPSVTAGLLTEPM